MRDYLLFKKMIAPTLLKILFWPALAASIYYSARLIIAGNPIGWVPLIVGSLFVRVLFEMLLLFFSINDNLFHIKQKLAEREEK
ncbi:MAG: hypothetical protein H6695_05975 [Deferribacteres bacterium]|nr:hypothetical protein [candidate division KSB1 bacterium]MCB9509709.1 hypothetical protein [Deferribacteres bacterium]